MKEFTIKVIDPLKKQQAKPGDRKPPSSNNDGNESKRQDGFALPNINRSIQEWQNRPHVGDSWIY